MSIFIEDGTGTGKKVKVDSNNRAQVSSTSSTLADTALQKGLFFLLATGIIELTSASASGILYIKNNEESDLLIGKTGLFLGPSTGGSGIVEYSFIANPTGGTLISNATAGVNVNANGGSARALSANVYKGVEGATTVGTDFTILFPHDDGVWEQGSPVILPRGSSVAIKLKPPVGNTSMKINLTVEAILLDNI